MTAVHSTGEDVVRAAHRWLGTPYRHQASCRGVGADCLGLIRGIWREVFGAEPEAAPAYTPDWSEASGEERLLKAAMRHLDRVPKVGMLPGDVIVFRMRDGSVAKHLGIAERHAGEWRVLHAYSGQGVVSSPLAPWKKRIAGVFRFRGIIPNGRDTC